MKQKIGSVLGIITFLILIGATSLFSQEAVVPEEAALEKAIAETQMESETQWLWGEVISVDIQKNELLIKYLDYETDQEKEVTITVDDETTYENIKALLEIKPQDTVSVDYIVSPEGKNIAKNISVEKPETIGPEGTEVPPAGIILPEDLQPSITTE